MRNSTGRVLALAVDRDVDDNDILLCLQELHEGLQDHFEEMLDYRKKMAKSQSFSEALGLGLDAVLETVQLSVRDKRGRGRHRPNRCP